MSNSSKQAGPPGWAVNFLRWFCPAELVEGIMGDLEEQFEDDLERIGSRKARRRFTQGVFRFLHPTILFRRKAKKFKFIHMGMYKSHLLVAIRSMKRHQFYSFINIFGLALAIAFVFLSFLFVKNEVSYDSFHKNDSIHRLYDQTIDPEDSSVLNTSSAIVAVPLAPDLATQVPGIKLFSRVGSASCTIVQNEIPYSEKVSFVDQQFFTMFNFPILAGSGATALSEPNMVVLSSQKASKFFGLNDPIGQTIEIILNDSSQTFVVTGVFDNKADESSIQADVLVPFEVYGVISPPQFMTSYDYSSIEAYVIFEKPDVVQGISPILSAVVEKVNDEHSILQIGVQPLSAIHLETEIVGNAAYTDPNKLYIIAALGLLVLVVALINFLTLATSHSLRRLKEMGLRKTMGAFKAQIRLQFILESFFQSFIAMAFGLALALLVTPYFNSLLQTSFEFEFGLAALLFVLGVTLFVALIAGGIQSSLLIKYSPVDALKGKNMLAQKDSMLNQSLMVLQFSLAIILIVGTLIIRAQMNYIQTKDIGYDKERLVEISLQSVGDLEGSKRLLERFRSAVSSDPRILNVSGSMNSFKEPWTVFGLLQNDETFEQLHFNKVDPYYVRTMGIEVVQGVDFDPSATIEKQIIVNEALVKHFGWDDPFSEQIPGKNFKSSHQIIGVIRDFHFSTLHNSIEPLVIVVDSDAILEGVTGLSTYVWPINMYTMMVRMSPGDVNEMLLFLESTWENVNPSQPFSYTFVDDVLAKNYAEEQQWQKMIDSASLFSIFIAWLGLLGMTRLSVQKRTKEIGIRKVLGSSTFNVTSLLSRRFLILVLISNLVAWPLVWLGSQKWLEAFAYRMDLNALPFLLGGVGVLLVALLSVGYQSYKASIANPVDALKYE